MGVSSGLTRPLLLVTRTLQWSSAVIVMGLVSYFIENSSPHGSHLVFQEVIATLSVAFFLPAFLSPFLPHVLSKFVLAIDILFSYLWLTSFIFAAQDYNAGDCYADSPPGLDCGRKRASEAFIFLAFWFTFTGVFLEVWSLWSYRKENAGGLHPEKNGRGDTSAA